MAENNVTLPAQRRDSSIRNGGKKTYREGMVAGVVYGKGTEPFTIKVDPRDLATALTTAYGRNAVITLDVDGETTNCMLKDTQFEPVRREITHFDLYVVTPEQSVLIDVPVEPVGKSVGEKLGGLMQVVSRTVKLRCAVKDIPVSVKHDVTKLQVTDQVYIDEMAAPEGCTLFYKNRFPVIRIASRRGAKKGEEETTTAAAAPAEAPAAG